MNTDTPPSEPIESAPQTATFDNVLAPDGRFRDGWLDRLPESMSPYKGPLSTVQDLPGLAKALYDNMSAARAKVSAPNENSTPEQIAQWRRVVGAPERPDGYGDIRPEQIPAEMWDSEAARKFSELAHRHHLPASAVKDIVSMYGGMVDEGMRMQSQQTEQTLALETDRLRGAWGERYEENLAGAQRFAATLGLKPDNPIFTNAEVVMAMAQGAHLISGDKLVNGASIGLSSSPRERATAIMTNPSDPLYARYQAGERDAVSLVTSLLRSS